MPVTAEREQRRRSSRQPEQDSLLMDKDKKQAPDTAGSEQSPDSEAPNPPSLWQRLNDGLYEFYVAPYRRTFARAQRDEEDLFMLLVFAETLGVPNPAAYYTLELLPVVYERFHEWHRRMGMEKSPLDHVHCC